MCPPFTGHPVKGVFSCAIATNTRRKCVEMYRPGQWPETPDGVQQKRFRDTVREWVRLENANGPEVLQHKCNNKAWTLEERLILVMQVISGKSRNSVALENGISSGMLYQLVRKYKILGYNGLVERKKGRPGISASCHHRPFRTGRCK